MSTTNTFPNGQELISSALTPDGVATIFQNLTLNILGYATPSEPTDPNYGLVRIMWQSQGQPAMTASQDIIYVGASLKPNNPMTIRDRNYIANTPEIVIAQIVYTRLWEVRYSVYGPNCFDNIRLIKDAIISVDFAHDILSLSNLYLVPDDTEPLYVPETDPVRGQWWKRVDYKLSFNEQVNETLTTQTVKTSEIKLYDYSGEIKDFTVVNANA